MKVGVIGNGQLGAMMVSEAAPLGISVDCHPTQIDDAEQLRRWAAHFEVVTYEWEGFPVELVTDLQETATVRPDPAVLATAQDRWNEKRFFDHLDIPVAPFRLCTDQSTLQHAYSEIGPDVVVKTRTGGYDGKGQSVVHSASELADASSLLVGGDVVMETLVDFDFEMSVILVRSLYGDVRVYPPVLNRHREGILRTSIAGPKLTAEQLEAVTTYVSSIAESLDYVGTLALETFVSGPRVLANEMAPRVHNSGHWTIEGAETSQFENHIRAVCGLPLGSTSQRCPAAMVNLIGELPAMRRVLEIPGARPHVYGKSSRPGRKLGHVTVTSRTDEELRRRVKQVEDVIAEKSTSKSSGALKT